MAGHVSVLLSETLEQLALRPGMSVVDGTLGRAGHAQAILDKIAPGGRLIGLDKDPAAIEAAAQTLEPYGAAAILRQADFRDIAATLEELGVGKVDGMLLDLGVSSPQLDEAGRGFSFQQDGPLDMRMDPGSELTAAEIVNCYTPERLREILWTLGEERMARRIVERLVEARRAKPVKTTKELENIVFHAMPKAARYGRIHPATRTFQALRIAVNGELEALEKFLKDAPQCLKEGGRLAVISFHSLEDRIVKQSFRGLERDGMGIVLTKKPVTAQASETETNPRSRSAKLRSFERREGGRS